MSGNIRFPHITGRTEAEQIGQIKSYLHQLVEQLNWMLQSIGSGTTQEGAATTNPAFGEISGETFYEMKSLLIQSSDTLNAYYEKINAKLEGQYVKQADFEAHKQESEQRFSELASQFVEQTGFYDEYKQDVEEQFDGLAGVYVAQTDFDTYKQENAGAIADLDNKYVSKADYDAYKTEVSQSIVGLQESINALQQIIESMQATGGE